MEPFSGIILWIASQGLPWAVTVIVSGFAFWLVQQLLKSKGETVAAKSESIEIAKALTERYGAIAEKNIETVSKLQTTLDVSLPLIINDKRNNGG